MTDAARPADARVPAAAPATLDGLTAAVVAAETGATAERAERVLPVATAMVQRYAPAADGPLQVEAALRFCGYLLGSDYGAVLSENIGPRQVGYAPNHADMFRRCGAAALLSPWRQRRAGAIG